MRKRVKPHKAADSGASKMPEKIYGRHAVRAVLNNPRRRIEALVMAEDHSDDEIRALADKRNVAVQSKSKAEIAELLSPPNSRDGSKGGGKGDGKGGRAASQIVHQNLVVLTQALPNSDFRGFVKQLQDAPAATLLVADRISDPQNIGAILRHMAAFGADAMILPTHHAPAFSAGTLAKAAAGAVELVPIFRQTNLSQTLQFLQKHGFWCYATDSNGDTTIDSAELPSHCAFVLGSEGEGVRPLVQKTCDGILRIPMMEAGEDNIASLNVSAAATIVLYQRYLKLNA